MGAAAQFLTPKELAERWAGSVTTGTLANWRTNKKGTRKHGPAFIKIGSKVLYPVDAVLEWELLRRSAANDNEQN